jgi:hypothetical protein
MAIMTAVAYKRLAVLEAVQPQLGTTASEAQQCQSVRTPLRMHWIFDTDHDGRTIMRMRWFEDNDAPVPWRRSN